MDHEDRRHMYSEQFELFRYQDTLGWSRIKTLAIIEAVMAYALTNGSPIPPWLFPSLVLAIAVLVLVVSLLAVKDGMDASYHVSVAADLGKGMGVPLRARPMYQKLLRGRYVYGFGLAWINAFNAFIVYKVFC